MRSCGADVFASSASDAQIDVRLRDRQARVAVGYHVNRLGRAVFRARAAMFVARVDDAVLFNKDDVAHLDEVFFLDGQGANRAGGADVAAHRAVEVAESVREVDARLQESFEPVLESGRLEHMGRAFRDAQMARNTLVVHALMRFGAGGRDREFPLNGEESVVGRFFFRSGGRFARIRGFRGGLGVLKGAGGELRDGGGRGQRRERYEVALAAVETLRLALNPFFFAERVVVERGLLRGCVAGIGGVAGRELRPAAELEVDRVFSARAEAVEAYDAAGIVDLLIFEVDTAPFARFGAEPAADAFVRVDARLKERAAGEYSQKGPDGADQIAVEPAEFARKERDYAEGNQPGNERADTLGAQVDVVERALEPLGFLKELVKAVVDKNIDRLEYVDGDSAGRPRE